MDEANAGGGGLRESPSNPRGGLALGPKPRSPGWELNFHKGSEGQVRPHCPSGNSGIDRPRLLSAVYKPWTGLLQLCTLFGQETPPRLVTERA